MDQNILIVSHSMDGTNMTFAVDLVMVSCSTCISGDVVCDPCKLFARERYKLRLPHSLLVGSFLFSPIVGKRRGTWRVSGQSIRNLFQVGFEIAAMTPNPFPIRFS